VKAVKILHLTPPGFGGIDSYIFNHYKYMNQKKFQFDFITQNQALENTEQYRNFQYKVYPIQAAVQGPDSFRTHIRKIFQNNYDILHLHTSYWTGFLLEELAKEAGIKKVIVHCHSSFIDESNDRKREQLLRHHQQVKQAFSPELATDFWACSKLAADWLFGPQIPKDKIKIMKNAIELEKYQFDKQKRNIIRRRLGVEDSLVLGTVGRLSYQKNHAFLIDVFLKFHQEHPKSKLIIIGDGELRDNLEKRIYDNHLEKDVLLLGWKMDVKNYLQAMDIFLLSSKFEGFPIATVEAIASGLPCIMSDKISKDEMLKENIYYIPLEVSKWNNTLKKVKGIPIDRRKGGNIVRSAGYDVPRQAKILEKLYIE